MPKSFTFEVELPDGTVARRSTSTRLYSHVVAVRGEHSWQGVTWSGSKQAADKAASDLSKRHEQVRVLPVGLHQLERARHYCPHLSAESLQSKSRRGARW